MVRFFRAMGERIQSLELQVAKLVGSTTQHGGRATTTSRLSRRVSSTSAAVDILKLTKDMFEDLDQKEELVYAIEMLVGDNNTIAEVRIRSKQLLKTFQNVMGKDIIPDPSQSMVITRPFKILMIFEHQLRDKRDDLQQQLEDQTFHDSNEYPEVTKPTEPSESMGSDRSAVKSYLDILFQALTTDLAEDCAAYLSMRARSQELITFPQLWFLFQPGDFIVEGRGKSAQAYCVLSVHEKISEGSQNKAEASLGNIIMLSIQCFYIGYNGKFFGPVPKEFTIRYFHKKTLVTSLPIMPIQYLREGNIQEQLVARGQIFTKFTTPRHQTYAGMTIDEKLPIELDGEVMVDINLYYRDHPDMIPLNFGVITTDENAIMLRDDRKIEKYLSERFLERNGELLNTFSFHQDEDTRNLSDERLMLLPNLVWAFYFRGRKWHALDINMISDVIYSQDPFDYLILPDGHKSIITSLVSTHEPQKSTQSDRPNNDLAVGRGKGLIMLYHGAPGVGKTSTAESLAAYAKMPLFPITAASIGYTPQDIENGLQTIFDLSQRWGCILLFDKADILLQARDRSDFKRNAIVSAVLRALEYYSGILIMTTNRVGTLDEAFKSRIHVVLYFPQLDIARSLEIWTIAFDILRHETNIEIDRYRIMKYIERQSKHIKWNGREIRNAARTAMALAEHEATYQGGPPILNEDHIRIVMEKADSFNKYMAAIYGGPDSMQARLVGDRDDDDDWDNPTNSRRSGSRPLYTTSRQIAKLAGTSNSDSD
ncbi:P-loop containing nucleoside triphosphate hydrolase protein [Nemania abortiva]|nr:P-loop containing nucleoside triphosphate hydrolase protein [Nemania abortiva]